MISNIQSMGDIKKAGQKEEKKRSSDPVQADGRDHMIAASIGLVSFPPGQIESSDKVIIAADEALYQAKKAGRDRVIRARGTVRKRKKKIRMRK